MNGSIVRYLSIHGKLFLHSQETLLSEITFQVKISLSINGTAYHFTGTGKVLLTCSSKEGEANDTGISFLSAEDKPVFLFRGTTYRNNSLVTLEDLGGGDDALHCITNDTDCCRHPFIKEFERSSYGNWFYPNDTRVQSEDVQWDFYRDRSLSIVHMFRRRGGDIGIYCCQLPYVTNDTAYLYIGVYTETTGE